MQATYRRRRRRKPSKGQEIRRASEAPFSLGRPSSESVWNIAWCVSYLSSQRPLTGRKWIGSGWQKEKILSTDNNKSHSNSHYKILFPSFLLNSFFGTSSEWTENKVDHETRGCFMCPLWVIRTRDGGVDKEETLAGREEMIPLMSFRVSSCLFLSFLLIMERAK